MLVYQFSWQHWVLRTVPADLNAPTNLCLSSASMMDAHLCGNMALKLSSGTMCGLVWLTRKWLQLNISARACAGGKKVHWRSLLLCHVMQVQRQNSI